MVYVSCISWWGWRSVAGSRLTPYASHLWTHKKKPVGQSPVKSAKGLQWLCWLLVSLVAEAAGVPSAGKVTANPRNSCCMADSLSSLLLVVTSLSSAGLCWDETEAGLSCGPWKAGEASGSPYSLSWPGEPSLAGSSPFAQSTGIWGMGWCKAKLKLLFLPFVCSYSQGFVLLCSWSFISGLLRSPRAVFIGRSLSNDWSLWGDIDLCGTVSPFIITASLLNIPVIMKTQSHRLQILNIFDFALHHSLCQLLLI